MPERARLIRLAAAGVLALLAGGCAAAPVGTPSADVILHGGRIVTLDAASTVAQALAIRGDRIVAVGDDRQMLALADSHTRRIDLAGRTVIPGLIDSHIHAIRAGLTFEAEASWIGAASILDAMERIRARARVTPPGQWIVVAGGWTEQQFAERRRPSQAELIAAAPDHPVYVQLSYRAVLLTPAGFRALSIASDGDLPSGARRERDAAGALTGWIEGPSPSIVALFARLPKPDLPGRMAGTRAFFRELNRLGLTGLLDPGGHNLAPEDYDALFALAREDALSLRVDYSIFAPRAGHELEDFQMLTRFLPMGMARRDGLLRFNGIGEAITWGLYNNETPSPAQKDDYYRVARWAAGQGLTLTQHWNSEKSLPHLLEIFERVNREIPLAPLRWSIAHLHDATPAALARMKALGLGWLMQDGTYFAAPLFLANRAPELRRQSPPIVSAVAMGLPVGAGTDAHRVMDYNPFVALRWMLDGLTVGGEPTRDAAEIPTREQALRLYTQGSAWFAFDETRRGSLEPGKLADLAVLDADYFAVPVETIARIQAVLTMVGGRVVYAAGLYGAAP
jgi:predicted amidohydrolase YtcJ